MYKEKLKNYVDKSDVVEFVLNNPDSDELLSIKFVKENNEYFCEATPCEEVEQGKYKLLTEEYDTLKDNIDLLPEDMIKMFVEKWEQMIVKTMFKHNGNE